jgi:hypothetical protein
MSFGVEDEIILIKIIENISAYDHGYIALKNQQISAA